MLDTERIKQAIEMIVRAENAISEALKSLVQNCLPTAMAYTQLALSLVEKIIFTPDLPKSTLIQDTQDSNSTLYAPRSPDLEQENNKLKAALRLAIKMQTQAFEMSLSGGYFASTNPQALIVMLVISMMQSIQESLNILMNRLRNTSVQAKMSVGTLINTNVGK